ncbi:HD domain-containing protein [Sediminibacillus massiliensis]|uniref:HD domain-containing protein n=1 Tax=Sediminibacillus massiliensis TaxID=1926277 RepID=UPI0009885344|nr:HD domain-containing protein [Sediminibacillus massiliensis]
MFIKDRLYGEFEVEKVLEDLIVSTPVQRLKGVHQGGASYLVNKQWNVTRYEHSIGVMLLIRKLGGRLEEQIAGLLHDISHTAFSHVIDFVFDNEKEDYHETIYHSIVENSEIPAILEKYDYTYKEILADDAKWTLLEQPAPELCADRVDYTLRDLLEYGQITREEAQAFLDRLVVREGKMYPDSIETAEWFAETYYKEVIDFFMDPLNVYANDTLAGVLRLSLEKGVVKQGDFLGEDEALIRKLASTNDKEINNGLRRLNPNVIVKEDGADYDLHRKSKVRMIDPSVLVGNELVRASEVSERITELNKDAHEKFKKGMFVKVISS